MYSTAIYMSKYNVVQNTKVHVLEYIPGTPSSSSSISSVLGFPESPPPPAININSLSQQQTNPRTPPM